MSQIALNFFPLATEHFSFRLYRLPVSGGDRPASQTENAIQRRINVEGVHAPYWTFFHPHSGAVVMECTPFDNVYATLDLLRRALISKCERALDAQAFEVTQGIRSRIEIHIASYPEGTQIVSLEPYLLRAKGKFGFLAHFRFSPAEAHHGTPRALQLSLAHDSYGRQNRSYYADRHSNLSSFIKAFHDRLFPLRTPDGQSIEVQRTLTTLESDSLALKRYVTGSRRTARSQFTGITQHGPFGPCPEDACIHFLFRERERQLSRELFQALRGRTFRTFSGMKRMFNFPISRDNVIGMTLTDYSQQEIERVRDSILASSDGRTIVPLVLTPFSRHDPPEENAAYWFLKHAFLSKGVPIQVVATDTIADPNKLKWSTASIGLQLFAKMGGTPWRVRPQTKRCLIVGIGQAHRGTSEGIERFFAYSVLTDSSGAFEEVRVLGSSGNPERYIASFAANLRQIVAEYSDRFSSFVVHTPFTIRRDELESVAAVLENQKDKQQEPGEFVVMKFNDRNRFFGFSPRHNTRMPHESTVTSISRREHLVWFEGRQYGRASVHKMIGGPVHVAFTYPHELDRHNQHAHLQDAINLSGANWRGFNAKSLPVSVYYAQLIAKYLRQFENHGLPMVDVNTLAPWFL